MLSKSTKNRRIVAVSLLAFGSAAIAKTWTWAIPEPPATLNILRAGQVAQHELGQLKKPRVRDSVRAAFAGVNNPTGLYLKISALSSIRYEEISFSQCGGGDGGVIQ